MSIKRILHLSSEASWRGGEQQMAYLIEESQKSGLVVSVAGKRDSAFANWCIERSIDFHPMGFKNGLDFMTSLRLKRLANQENFDLIHSHSGKSQSIAYWATMFGMKKPIVVHRRVDFPLKSSGFSLKKYTVKNVKAIICVSKTIENMVREKVGSVKKVVTIYSGIDFTRFSEESPTGYLHRELGIDPQKILVANVSALADQKDYPTFLKTVKVFTSTSDKAHFLIVGDGNLRTQLERMSSDLGIENHVTFTGFRNDIPQLFREISIFLITSKTEGLGTTVIDAMHNSIPVVATRGGGIPELVRDQETGLLCGIGDYAGLTESLASLIKNPERAKAMGQNARSRSKLFSKEEMAKHVIELYKKLEV